MSKPVRLAREARAELHEAARRYGEQRPELRIEFLAAIDETMERMVRLAKHLGSPPGIDPTLGIKRVFVKRFPFSVYFIELPTHFRVLAVANSRRSPFHPERAAVIFELCVAGMLLVLGARAIVVALGAAAAVQHAHIGPHLGSHGRAHPVVRTLVWRPLTVGLVHGLAGSGALTAIAFAELPGAGARLLYVILFGLGSIAGMALASGAAGVTLRVIVRSGGARRGLALVTGALSITVGVMWSIPLWSRL